MNSSVMDTIKQSCAPENSTSLLYYSAEQCDHETHPEYSSKCGSMENVTDCIEGTLIHRLKLVRFAVAGDLCSPVLRPTMTSTPIARRGILKKPFREIHKNENTQNLEFKGSSKSVAEKIISNTQNWYQSDYVTSLKNKLENRQSEKCTKIATEQAVKMYRERFGYMYPSKTKRIGLRV